MKSAEAKKDAVLSWTCYASWSAMQRPPKLLPTLGTRNCSDQWFENSLLGRSLGGHSMRPGGATFYASLGLSEATIHVLGRWSSGTWQIYLRDHPANLASSSEKIRTLGRWFDSMGLKEGDMLVESLKLDARMTRGTARPLAMLTYKHSLHRASKSSRGGSNMRTR